VLLEVAPGVQIRFATAAVCDPDSPEPADAGTAA
jgi:hypothetical protein